jgi:hypothetical protein
VDEMGRAYSTHREKMNAYRILVGKPKEKRPLLGRLRCRWKDNMAMDLTEIGKDCIDEIDVAQVRDQ